MTYDEFLKTKEMKAEACGFEIDRNSITSHAFDLIKLKTKPKPTAVKALKSGLIG